MYKEIKLEETTEDGRVYWIRYAILGPKGAMSTTFADWNGDGNWKGTDLSIHSAKPLYNYEGAEEWHKPMTCDLLGELPCYCDGTSLPGTDHLWGNDVAIYALLVEEYEARFEGIYA